MLNPTPLSPVPETDHGVKGGMINLALAPKNRAEMISRRNEAHSLSLKHHQPHYEFPKPPPRPGINSNVSKNQQNATKKHQSDFICMTIDRMMFLSGLNLTDSIS